MRQALGEQTANPIDRAAADWVAALERGLSSEEETSLAVWRAADERHEGALVRSQAIWRAVGEHQAKPAARTVPRPAFSPLRRRLVMSGAAVAASAAGLAWLNLSSGQRFETHLGEVRRLPLSDGSSVSLNTDTRLTTRYSDRRRDIHLDRGEAWFDVAKDAARPFVVAAGPVTVTAVGTAFTVRRRDGHVEILVTEGVVETRHGAVVRRVEQGQTALTDPNGAISVRPLEPTEIDRRLAWRSGLIVLDGERMATAVETFNRYSRRPIDLAPGLADEQMVGVFRVQDAEGFAQAAGNLLNVPVRIESDRIQIGDS